MSATSVRITYFDTAMILLEIGSLRLLTDPVFDGSGAAFDYGPIVLRKTSDRPITPEALGRIDAVLLSHDQHGDNLDESGRAFLPSAGRVVTTELAATRLAGVAATGLAPWAGTELVGADGFRLQVVATPAEHGPEGTLEATGPVTGFLLSWEGASGPIYVSGDTVLGAATDAVAERAAPVALAVLHIGHVLLAPFGDTPFSLTAAEAAGYAERLGARHIVPVHFEGWEHFSEGRAAAREAFGGSAVAERVAWLEPGVAKSFTL